VYAIAFNNPYGDKIVTGSFDKTCKLWDAYTGQLYYTLKGHQTEIVCLSFNPQSTIIATGSMDNTAKLWDVETGQERSTLLGHRAEIVSLGFNTGGDLVVTGSFDHDSRLWDVRTGQCVHVLSGHRGEVSSTQFNYAGTLVVSGSIDCTSRLWDVRSGRCLSVKQGHTDEVLDVAFDSAGTKFVSASADGTSRLYNTLTGVCQHTMVGHEGEISKVAFNPQPGEAPSTQTLVACVCELRPLSGADEISSLELGPALQLYSDPGGEPVAARLPCTAQDPVWDPYSSAVYMIVGQAIMRLSSDDTVTVVAGAVTEWGDADGPGRTAGFLSLRRLVCDGAGSLYVADDKCIRKLQLPGLETGSMAGQLDMQLRPEAVGGPAAALSAGSGPAGGALGGQATGLMDEALVSTLPFRAPDDIMGLAFDGGGSSGSLLFMTLTALYRLPLGDPSATPLLLAGAEGEASIVDGRGPVARFRSIWGIVLDGEGSVYAADLARDDTTALRRVTADGNVTTVVGGLEGSLGTPAILPNGCLALNEFDGDILHVLGLGLKLPRCHAARELLPTGPIGPSPRTLPADLRALLDRQPDSTADVAIVVGDRTFHAHRLLLSARSDYFQQRFGGGFADGSAQQLNLPDADPDAFEVALGWVYTDTADIPAALAAGVAELANRLQLPELCEQAVAVVEATVAASTVVGLLLWAEANEGRGPAFSELLSRLKAWYVGNHEAVLREAKEEVRLLAARNPDLMLELMCGMSTRPPKRTRTR
ncbi:Outer row dynein assembly protein 16, partial [Tetrabaena socialis]